MAKAGNIERVVERADTELMPPSMYKVILNNDDYTPMDFVVEVLQLFFKMNEHQATEIMLQIQIGRAHV